MTKIPGIQSYMACYEDEKQSPRDRYPLTREAYRSGRNDSKREIRRQPLIRLRPRRLAREAGIIRSDLARTVRRRTRPEDA